MFILELLIFNLLNNFVNCVDSGLSRRQSGGYQMCLDAFDVYEDKIIRTQDSRELGAKYISERDVQTRQECYQFCCDTDTCDVFVFEERRPGSCYLFECGPPNNFKCKFTKHRNYTSGVINTKHLSDLETEIKFTQHEHELNNLREPDKSKVENAAPKSTTPPPGSKETLQLVPQEPPKHAEKVSGRCSRYQFECHTSHECIAVYNACDGIPQCADGSDEAPELDCPNQGTAGSGTKEPSKVSSATSIPQTENYRTKEQIEKSNQPEAKYQADKPPSHQQYVPHETVPQEKVGENDVQLPAGNTYQNTNPQRQAVSGNSRLAYGREGEGLARNQENQWNTYNDRSYHQNQGNGQIFGHKGNGIMSQNDRYQPPHNFPDSSSGNMGYNSDGVPNDLMRYNNYYENQQYGRMGPPNQYGQSSWQSMHKNDMNQMGGEEGMMKSDRYSNTGGIVPQEFYYDENAYRSRQQIDPSRQQIMDNRQRIAPPSQIINQGNPAPLPHPQTQDQYEHRAHMELTNLKNMKDDTVKSDKVPLAQITTALPATTVKSKAGGLEHQHITHIKFEKLTADAAFAPTEIDGHSTSPSGAILSLTFGLLITAITVVLVGCRVRTVRRRMRRGGKAFAHDADFLVNGMYL